MSRRSQDRRQWLQTTGHRRRQQSHNGKNGAMRHAYEPGARAAAGSDDNFIEAQAACRATSSMERAVILSATLALVLYLNTLPAEFAYDDSRAILKNPDVLGETAVHDLFYNDFWGTPLTHSGSHKSYRPLCVLTFRLNHQLGGLDPSGYHLLNVLLHSVVTALFTYTAHQLLQHSGATLVAGLMFASHPIHTEAVAGVVGRADILACLFFLLSFQCYMRYCKHRDKGGGERWAWLGGVALFTTAGMLSKEQAVTVLGVCIIYDVFLHSRLCLQQLGSVLKAPHRHVLEGIVSLALIGSLLISFRLYFMGNKPPEFAPADNPASDSDSLMTRTLTFHYLPFANFWILLFPSLLSFDWSMDAVPLVESVFDYRNILTLSFYGMMGYVAWYALASLPREIEKKSPVHSNGVKQPHPLTNGTVPNGCASHNGVVKNGVVKNGVVKNGHARQRTSVTRRGSNSSTDSSHSNDSASSSVAIATGHQTAHIIIISLALLILPFIPATNFFFYVGFVIAERILYIPSMGYCLLFAQGAYTVQQKLSHQGALRKQLMTALVGWLILGYSIRTVHRNQDWLNEESLYRAGIAVNPAKAWGNLANILNSQGRSTEAEQAYRSALLHRANMADVHYNLGILLQEQQRHSEAIESYKLAIQCRPRLTMAHLNLAIVYASVGRKSEAEQIFRHCSEIDISGLKDPRLHEQTKISALYNLGRQLADEDRNEEAIEVYQEAIARRPGHYSPQSLYNMLGESYSKLDDLVNAEHWYRQALAVKPDHIPAHLTMGKLMKRKGDVAGAESWFLKAKLLDGKDSSIYQHYGQFLGEIGRHSEAADNYVQASLLTPSDFELIFNTANALRQAARNAEAEDFYKKAAQLRPLEPTAHMNLGAMLHYNNKLAEAEQSYLAALKLRPDDKTTQTNLQRLRNLINLKSGGS